MSRRKRMQNRRGPHKNKYASESRAEETGKSIERRHLEYSAPITPKQNVALQERPKQEARPFSINTSGLENKIIYVTDRQHDDVIEKILRRLNIEPSIFYTKKDAAKAIDSGSSQILFVENLNICSAAGRNDYDEKNGIQLCKYALAKKIQVVALAPDNLDDYKGICDALWAADVYRKPFLQPDCIKSLEKAFSKAKLK